MRRSTIGIPAALLLVAAMTSCGGTKSKGSPTQAGSEVDPLLSSSSPPESYPISERGGTPATGPEKRYNHCERIWCLTHGENFFIDHFLSGHVGYVLHDEPHGDVFAPRLREGGPAFPHARATVLFLCGQHVHPFLLDRRGGSPIRHTGFNHTLGYGKTHFWTYGTRLDPCCINGLGSGFVHSMSGKQFRFHELAEYRLHPEIGWQKPFPAKVDGSGVSDEGS